MSIKNLPKSLIDSVMTVMSERNTERDDLTNKLFSQGLRRFGVKKECQLAESDYRALHAWVQTKLYEICSCNKSYYEDHMPGDEIFYNKSGEMKTDLGEQEAQDIVKSELKRMNKSFDELSSDEKRDLFNKVDSLIKAKNEELNDDEDEKVDVNESIAIDPEDLSTNGAVAIGDAMEADPIAADVIRDTVTQNEIQYRLLLQYATGGDTYKDAPYEGTHMYPPASMPGASSIEMLRDMIEAMPFYNKIVEKALKRAVEFPHKDPMFSGNDKEIVESKTKKRKV